MLPGRVIAHCNKTILEYFTAHEQKYNAEMRDAGERYIEPFCFIVGILTCPFERAALYSKDVDRMSMTLVHYLTNDGEVGYLEGSAPRTLPERHS